MLSALYGMAARQRRRWYDHRPGLRRRLAQPVISVGALTVGGSGKTPIVAYVAEILTSIGEHPAVLSRGYGRRVHADGVVVVSSHGVVQASLDLAGDEPLMLARRLHGTSVLVADDRYVAGRLAEMRLGATVHLLDDGFQHVALHRDIDLVVVGAGDAMETRTLPGGRLREPFGAAGLADAVIVDTSGLEPADAEDAAHRLAARAGAAEAFGTVRWLDRPRRADGDHLVELVGGERFIALAGIARPERFVSALEAQGYDVADVMTVRDHHQYTARDIDAIARRVEAEDVDHVVTTEKDLMRLLPHAPLPFSLAWVPLAVSIEPADRFREWLAHRLAAAFDTGRSPRAAIPIGSFG